MSESTFSIFSEEGANGQEIILKNNSNGEFVNILPDHSARLKEVHLFNGEEVISVVRKSEHPASSNRDELFTNAKLSPFAGRIKEGSYSFHGSAFQLEKNYPEENNACHGFIYDKKFNVIGKIIHEDFVSCVFTFEYDGLVPGYPFAFGIEITYKLTSSHNLICTTSIINRSGKPMPLSDGWHFYFDLGITVNDLKLKIDACEKMELDRQMIPTGKKAVFIEYTAPQIIGSTEFDSCFMLSAEERAETQLLSEEKNIDLRIWQEAGQGKYRYLNIYTPPDRKTIAIEPMTSNINSFNNGEGLITLPPHGTFSENVGFYLKPITKT